MAKLNIMIVEDERIVAEHIHIALKSLGYYVSSILSSGEEAIKDIRKNTPDLILLDIKLNGNIDGVEAAERIRAQFDIPIVYITALGDETILQRAKMTEPFGYILKPVEERELKSVIEIAIFKHDAEKKIKESEERFRELVEKAEIAILIDDDKGNFRYLNKTFARLFGCTRKEIAKQSIQSIIHPEDVNNVMNHRKMSSRGKKKSSRYAFRGIRKDGSTIFLEVITVPLMEERKIVELRSYIWDVTERKQAEEEKERLQAQLIQAEKMAGLGTLASGIAHEFNNLLQIIGGHAEFAKKTMRPKDMEEALDIILKTNSRATKITKDLLAFSRKETTEKEILAIDQLIEQTLSLVEDQLKKSNIIVKRRYEQASGVEINKGEMQQVFLNLIANASDAMSSNGGKLEIWVRQDGDHIKVSFRDAGEGIEKENLAKVFEPFYTSKEAAGENAAIVGTGLGLSVSYGIVKRHGGAIEVDSRPGKWTIFTISLPANGEKARKKVAKYKRKKQIKKTMSMNVLVVDDEEEICKMFTKFLTADGHKTKAVATGRKAINQVKKEFYDFVFLDIVLPGIPCTEVLDRIKKILPKTNVVIITGGLLNKVKKSKFRRKGAYGFLQKPFKIEDIMESLKEKKQAKSKTKVDYGKNSIFFRKNQEK